MSPEQLLGDPIDARSDLYALGCIMHLMLTASPPFAAPTREQMIKRRLTEDAPHVQQLDPGLPDSLNRIVARLLARSPSDRYGSAVELRDALAGTHARRLDADGMVRSMRPTPRSAPTLAFESAALAPTEKTEMVATVGTRPRRRATLLALGAVALTGAAFAAMSTHGSGAASPPPAPRAAVPAPKTPPITRPLVAAPVESAPRKVVPVVDSAALRRARARRDSIARANAAARAGSVEAEIARYARAIASGSVNNLKEAYPNLTDQQQAYWETNFFAKAERISATVRNIRVTQTATRAEADFTVIVGYDYKTSSSGSTPLKQHAVLMKTPTGWRITEIR
jgi:serine/threonine-protein kinase